MTTSLPPPSTVEFYEENDLSDKCRDLISTLPREKGWITEHVYQYEGFWIEARFLQALVTCQKAFQARDTDTILTTHPKCGTTWLKAMAFALLNRSRLFDVHDQSLLTTNPHDLVPFLEVNLYRRKEIPDLSTLASPRIFATHVHVGSLPRSIKDSACKIVYMCRNPKDAFVSFWHFSNKLRPKELGTNKLEDVFDQFCNGVNVYGCFWDHVLGYWNESLKNPQKVLFLKYEEFQEQYEAQLKRLAEFLECPFSPEEEANDMVSKIIKLCSFTHLKNLEVNKSGKLSYGHDNDIYFRKGEVGNWGKVLTPEMAKKLDRITELKMRGSGLKF